MEEPKKNKKQKIKKNKNNCNEEKENLDPNRRNVNTPTRSFPRTEQERREVEFALLEYHLEEQQALIYE